MMQSDIEGALARDMPMVYHIASKYIGIGRFKRLDWEDLVQTGVVGYLHAWLTFDPERNKDFSEYAYCCIQHHIYMYVRDYNSIHMPRSKSHDPVPVVSMHTIIEIEPDKYVTIEGAMGRDSDFTSVFVEEFLATLTERERKTIAARIAGYKEKEIAEMMGTTVGAVESRVVAVKRKYRKYAASL